MELCIKILSSIYVNRNDVKLLESSFSLLLCLTCSTQTIASIFDYICTFAPRVRGCLFVMVGVFVCYGVRSE